MCGRAKRGSTTPLEESEMRTRAGGLGSFSPLEIATEPKEKQWPFLMECTRLSASRVSTLLRCFPLHLTS